jgi:hypothetical protein
MRLNKQQFAEKIAEKSGLNPEESAAFLEALLAEVEQSLEQSGSYRLKGFGSFEKSADGSLVFETDQVLALELNYEYAGLEPIVVKAKSEEEALEADSESPNDQIEEDVDEDASIDEMFPLPDDAPVIPDDEELDELEAEVEEPTDDLEEDEDSYEAFINPGLRVTENDFDAIEEDEAGGFAKEVDPDLAALFEQEEPEEVKVSDELNPHQRFDKEADQKDAVFEKFRAQHEADRKKNTRAIVFTVLAAIVIGVLSWIFVIQPYLLNSSEPVPQDLSEEAIAEDVSNTPVKVPEAELELEAVEESEPKAETEVEKASNQDQNAASTAAVEQPIEAVTAPQKDVEDDTAPVEAAKAETLEADPQASSGGIEFGLAPGQVANIANSTTIVVHSLNNQEAAEEAAALLKNQGYKTVIFKAQLPDGRTFWRVGLGQFRNFNEAAQARETLKAPYNERSFVAKIIF